VVTEQQTAEPTNKTDDNKDTKGSSAPAGGVNTLVLSSVVGLALAFVYGMGL